MTARVYLVMKSDGVETFATPAEAQARAVDWVTSHPTEMATIAETMAEVYIPPQTPIVMPVTDPPAG